MICMWITRWKACIC